MYVLVLARYRLGTHFFGSAKYWNIDFSLLQIGLVAGVIYCFVILTIKLAILLQYLRIFSIGRDTTFWVYRALIWLHIAYYLINPFLQIFQCYPVEKYWKPWIREGHCMYAYGVHVFSASVNSASDIFIFIVPQKIIWNLQMSLEKKIGVSAIFFVAFLWAPHSITFILQGSWGDYMC